MVYRESITVQSNDKVCTFHDVTAQLREIVGRSGIQKRDCGSLFPPHDLFSDYSECAFDYSITGLETLQQDLVDVFETWIPTCRRGGPVPPSGPQGPGVRRRARRRMPGLPQHRCPPAIFHHRSERHRCAH